MKNSRSLTVAMALVLSLLASAFSALAASFKITSPAGGETYMRQSGGDNFIAIPVAWDNAGLSVSNLEISVVDSTADHYNDFAGVGVASDTSSTQLLITEPYITYKTAGMYQIRAKYLLNGSVCEVYSAAFTIRFPLSDVTVTLPSLYTVVPVGDVYTVHWEGFSGENPIVGYSFSLYKDGLYVHTPYEGSLIMTNSIALDTAGFVAGKYTMYVRAVSDNGVTIGIGKAWLITVTNQHVKPTVTIEVAEQGLVYVRVMGQSDRYYFIEYTSDLASGEWKREPYWEAVRPGWPSMFKAYGRPTFFRVLVAP